MKKQKEEKHFASAEGIIDDDRMSALTAISNKIEETVAVENGRDPVLLTKTAEPVAPAEPIEEVKPVEADEAVEEHPPVELAGPDEQTKQTLPVEPKEPAEPYIKIIADDGKELQVPLSKLTDVGELILTIDGKEQKVPLSKALDAGKRTLQKEVSADRRLEEATELLRQARATTPTVATTPIEKAVAVPDPSKALDVEIVKAVKAIQYGEEGEAAEALQALLHKTRHSDQITEDVLEQLRVEKIRDKFNLSPEEGGFRDLVDDKRLFMMARYLVDEKLRAGEKNTWDLYATVGKEIRGWRDGFKVVSPPTPIKDSFAEKQERKKTVPTPITSLTVKTQAANSGEINVPTADIISQMSAARQH